MIYSAADLIAENVYLRYTIKMSLYACKNTKLKNKPFSYILFFCSISKKQFQYKEVYAVWLGHAFPWKSGILSSSRKLKLLK